MRLLFDPESEVTDEEGTTALGVVGQPPHQEEEGDAFDATRDTLIRLVAEYWHEQQERAPSGQLTDTIDEFILTHVLDYRHHGTVDGRLALWRQEHVRAVLLEWLPRHVTVLPDEAAEHDAPAAVAALVDFLAAAAYSTRAPTTPADCARWPRNCGPPTRRPCRIRVSWARPSSGC